MNELDLDDAAADLRVLCDACGYVREWVDLEISELTRSQCAAEYQDTIDMLIVFKVWLEGQWITFANHLEPMR